MVFGCPDGYGGRVMTIQSDHNRQTSAGQLTLLTAATIVLVFFACTYVLGAHTTIP